MIRLLEDGCIHEIGDGLDRIDIARRPKKVHPELIPIESVAKNEEARAFVQSYPFIGDRYLAEIACGFECPAIHGLPKLPPIPVDRDLIYLMGRPSVVDLQTMDLLCAEAATSKIAGTRMDRHVPSSGVVLGGIWISDSRRSASRRRPRVR